MAQASKWKKGQGMVDVPVHAENYNGTLVVTIGQPGKYIDVEIERDEIKGLMGLGEPCGWEIKPMPTIDDESADRCKATCPTAGNRCELGQDHWVLHRHSLSTGRESDGSRYYWWENGDSPRPLS